MARNIAVYGERAGAEKPRGGRHRRKREREREREREEGGKALSFVGPFCTGCAFSFFSSSSLFPSFSISLSLSSDAREDRRLADRVETDSRATA